MKHYYSRRDAKRNHESKKKSAEASLTSGLVFSLAFGIVWFTTKQWFWVFPFAFAGVLPAVDGLMRMLTKKRLADNSGVDENVIAEKEVLRIAKNQNGRVTPALIVLNSNLSIEKAESVLENMAKRGYASMQVTGDGRIEYEFPEFLPPSGD